MENLKCFYPTSFQIQNLWERNLKRHWGLTAKKFNHVGDTPNMSSEEGVWPMLDIHLDTPEKTFTEALLMLSEQGIKIPCELELYRFLRDMKPELEEIFWPQEVVAWHFIHMEKAFRPNNPQRMVRETTGTAVLWWLATFPEMLSEFEGVPIVLDGFNVDGQIPALLIEREDNVRLIRWPEEAGESGERFWWPTLNREIFPIIEED